MKYTSIENMLQMSRGGTVSGREPTIITDAQLDAKSGDAAQTEQAKKNLFDAMREKVEEIPPEEGAPESPPLTEADLQEFSTGQVDAVLSRLRGKLIKRGQNGRPGTLRNIAKHAEKAILSLGEANTAPGTTNTPGYGEQKPKTMKTGYSMTEKPLKQGATAQAQKMEGRPSMTSQGKDNKPIGEEAMSDADVKKAAAAANEKAIDKVWDKYEPESARTAGLKAKTKCPVPMKEAIAAFAQTAALVDALDEWTTASGTVKNPSVYTDPVSTMKVNAAYRTDLLKVSQGGGKVAGACGKAKTRDVKPGDPIGEEALDEAKKPKKGK